MSRTMSRQERLFFGAIQAFVGAVMALALTALGLPWYMVLGGYVVIIAWDGWKLDREWHRG